MIKNILKGMHNIVVLIGYTVVLFNLGSYGQSLPVATSFKSKDIKKIAKYTQPLKTPSGERYCSSVAVTYKGVQRTLTNRHCCDIYFYEYGLVRIGNRLEQILYLSGEADVCVLTSSVKSPIRVAKFEFSQWDEVLVMGYPLGLSLTPRVGYVLQLDIPVAVRYSYAVEERYSNLVSAPIFPGNSGSPVFNTKGEVVNLIYAGPFNPTIGYGISVPLAPIKNALEASLVKP